MGQIGVNGINQFEADTPAVADKFNENFSAIKSAHNETDTRVKAIEDGSGALLKADGSIASTSLQKYVTKAITGATNATPIVITATGHGRSNGDIVYIDGIVGNTAPNGKSWTIANKTANTFELAGSVGNGSYTSGGTVYLLPKDNEDLAPTIYVDNKISIVERIKLVPFALYSGNKDVNGNADILAYSGTTLSFKIGGSYPSAVFTYADKTQETIASIANITGMSTGGAYTVIKKKGVATASAMLSTKVTQGKLFPTSPSTGDLHCDTSTEDMKTYEYSGSAWVETQYVPLGIETVAANVISSVFTNPYGDNGWDRGVETLSRLSAPSSVSLVLTLGASGSSFIAPTDGYLYLSKMSTAAGQYVSFTSSNLGTITKTAYSATYLITNCIRVNKGELVVLSYTTAGATGQYKFVYTEGSKP